MSNWPGKFIIGLTGNIATGKSVVRRMLEHLGAFTIDADAISHRVILKRAPGYQKVVETFGNYILNSEEEVDRAKLGLVVFNNPDALKILEGIIHPFVEYAVDLLIRRASQPVVVIEAIKLLEGKLRDACDSIWVTYAPNQIQQKRLINERFMSDSEAKQRINSQTPQELKMTAANVIIHTAGSYNETWNQVLDAWNKVIIHKKPATGYTEKAVIGGMSIRRGIPQDSANIAGFLTKLGQGVGKFTEEDILSHFGEMAFLLLLKDGQLVGIAGWQVENLVYRTTQFHIDSKYNIIQGLHTMVKEIDQASRDLQCEISLIFLPEYFPYQEEVWKQLGYSRRTVDSINIQAWKEAAFESQPPASILLFKQLRKDRVLHPI